MLLHHDHVDLIVTAALTWKVLIGPPAAALSMPGTLASLDGSRAGSLILEQNRAATRATGRDVGPYVFSAVEEPLVAVEVLKACHAASHACRGSHAWETSVAQTLLVQTAWAAAVRMPGYADAPWSWRRTRTREVLAIAHGWKPAPLDVEWVDMAEVTEDAWQRAALVIVAGEAVQQVGERLGAGELSSRPNVFAISTGDHVAAATWNGDIDHILHWPECTDWLSDQLASLKIGA